MSGQNVITLDPSRRLRRVVFEGGPIAMMAFLVVQAMMFAGMVSAFLLTRAVAGGTWPLAGQPLLPLEQTAVNAAALLASGVLVFLAAQARAQGTVGIGPRLLLAAVALGAFFVLFQGLEWVALIRHAASLSASQHVNFFCLIVGLYAVYALGAVIFMSFAWLRLRRGALGSGTFSAARFLWYFVVAAWPVLYVCIYL